MAERIKGNNDIEFADQGLTCHVITFKTNHLFLKKDNISMEEIANQTLDMVGNDDNDHVLFNA